MKLSCPKKFVALRHNMFCSIWNHYNDVIMSALASQITGISIVCSTVGSGADQRKHQNFASLIFVRGIHRWPSNSPHKRPVMRKMFPFDDVIMMQEKTSSSHWDVSIFNSPLGDRTVGILVDSVMSVWLTRSSAHDHSNKYQIRIQTRCVNFVHKTPSTGYGLCTWRQITQFTARKNIVC